MERLRGKWRKLDNAALAFPAATGKKDSRVFRFYCLLNEQVRQEPLQRALEQTMEKYPLYQAVLRKGLFWFYLEHRDIRPLALAERRPPCSKLYIPDRKTLLFEVSYHKNRINFEVFHGLTDGTGAMRFLKELVKNYLRTVHPDAVLPDLLEEDAVTQTDQEQDSFSRYYSGKSGEKKEKKRKACRLSGAVLEQDEMEILEAVLPVHEVLAKAHECLVSVTVLITAMFLWAIHEEVPRLQARRPITLMVPVNLRNYFPSHSMTNFFGWIEVGYTFEESTTFADVLLKVRRLFERELVKERLGAHFNELVKLEKNPLLRAVPLEIKQLFLMAGTTLGGRSITSVYSNIGVVRMPAEYEAYIQRFGFFASTDRLQLCSCSYKDSLVLGFTSKIPGGNIQRNFLKLARDMGIGCQELSQDYPGVPAGRPARWRQLYRIFSFLCLAAAVICGMTDFLISHEITWSAFAAGICLITWVLVSVTYRKRRNPLKGISWLLILFSGSCALLDYFTGWHGWSVDFVFPIACLVVLFSMGLITKVLQLEPSEYLFYLIQGCAFGILPLLLFIAGIIKVPAPSVLCGGVSFLFFMALMIFRPGEVRREMHKKFRL